MSFVSMYVTKFLSDIMELALPRQCPGCGRILTGGESSMCVGCQMGLPRIAPSLWPGDRRWRMFADLPYVVQLGAFSVYRRGYVAARLVRSVKYYGYWRVGVDMGRMLGRELAATGVFGDADVLLPMPISWRRMWRRGYCQAEVLARGVSQVTGIPIGTGLLRRTRHTESQTHFSFTDRLTNVEGAFGLAGGAEETLRGCTAVLLDDVMTTGSTMRAAAMALGRVRGLRLKCIAWTWTA